MYSTYRSELPPNFFQDISATPSTASTTQGGPITTVTNTANITTFTITMYRDTMNRDTKNIITIPAITTIITGDTSHTAFVINPKVSQLVRIMLFVINSAAW
jgi:6,7-dimethyl-8-ribityllumazine synthase